MTEATTRLPDLPGRGQRVVPPWPGESVSFGDQELFVRRAVGSPPPGDPREVAVFVHGLGGASTNWTDLMFLLRPSYDCYAPDLPGFGHSGPPPRSRYTLDTHVRAVIRLIERLQSGTGCGAVHLFGNSLGGAVATRLAAERPDLVRSLTLVSPALPALRPRRGTDPRLALMLLPGVSRTAMWALGRQPAHERARAVIELCFADPSVLPEERLAEAAKEVERRRGLMWNNDALVQSLRGLVATYVERGPRALWRQAASLRVPTLLVWGRHDRLVHTEVGERAAQVIPGARLVVLEHCGHVSQMEDPVRVAAEFLALVGAG